MAATREDKTLHNSILSVRCDIQDIVQSGEYYVTEEIAKELSVINNALEHLSLDNTFLATSKEWQQNPGNYTPTQTLQHLSGALVAVNQVGATLNAFKHNFCNENIAGKQENQLRELHQWAISSLKHSQKNLEPYAFDSADRIKQFGDSLGVTERYTSHRQNLTRGTRDPFRLQTTWMDKAGEQGLMNNLTRSHATPFSPTTGLDHESLTIRYVGDPSSEFSEFGGVPPANIGALKKQIRYGFTQPPMRVTPGYRTIDSLYPKSTVPLSGGVRVSSSVLDEVKTLNALNACDFYAKADRVASSVPAPPRQPHEAMSAQEQAGINTIYPGKTEYMLQFKAPDREAPTSDFQINPSPDFTVYGRPLEASCYLPTFTEYQTRYEWPNGSKITKVPWLMN